MASTSSRLAVALDAGDAEDLAGAHARARRRAPPRRARRAPTRRPSTSSTRRRLRRGRAAAARAAADRRADHRGRRASARRASPRAHSADRPAAAHHGDAVGDRQHLVELVGDEHDGRALARRSAAQHAEQLARPRRGVEHRGRLVEDEHFGAAVQHLQDLDPLLLADRERRRSRRRDRPRSPKRSAERARPRAAGARMSSTARGVGSRPSTTFSATVSVGDQHEVLVHHADAARDRRVGECVARSTRRAARPAIAPGVGAYDGRRAIFISVRLAGAVLADQRVDRAPARRARSTPRVGHAARRSACRTPGASSQRRASRSLGSAPGSRRRRSRAAAPRRARGPPRRDRRRGCARRRRSRRRPRRARARARRRRSCPADRVLDGLEHRHVDALDHAGQDAARRLVELVGVDADRQRAALARRLEHAEPRSCPRRGR